MSAKLGPSINNWLVAGILETDARAAIGETAKKKDWFKDLNHGQELAKIVVDALPKIHNSPLATDLSVLEKWVYAE